MRRTVIMVIGLAILTALARAAEPASPSSLYRPHQTDRQPTVISPTPSERFADRRAATVRSRDQSIPTAAQPLDRYIDADALVAVHELLRREQTSGLSSVADMGNRLAAMPLLHPDAQIQHPAIASVRRAGQPATATPQVLAPPRADAPSSERSTGHAIGPRYHHGIIRRIRRRSPASVFLQTPALPTPTPPDPNPPKPKLPDPQLPATDRPVISLPETVLTQPRLPSTNLPVLSGPLPEPE
jgi:hypothetical protein